MNQITDPLAAQKTAAANIGLNNYQNASAAVPSLQNYYNQNFGQSQGQTLAGMNPMFQDIYNSVQGDVSGSGGPFASLKQNLLGSFDTGQKAADTSMQNQLQAQGLMGTGAGMALEGQEGTQAAQQRATLGANTDVSMLNMANQLAQELTQQNQVQGFQNPMTALQQIQSLMQPPEFQSPETTYYTPASKFNTTADIIGAVSQGAGQLAGSLKSPQGAPMSVGAGNGAPAMGAPAPTPSNYYTNGGQGNVASMMNNPQLLQMIMQMGPAAAGG